ncbi:hypothetical protein TIFTF001_006361 [Ficus carica]|uniref:DUF4220 domain-containing protein n=1 Tax=Ficus carica TaxID=3494 RepID=A0AA88CZN6_FICCA|nr:hypothetical protein TIFTF001_006361 [Ficus carica]
MRQIFSESLRKGWSELEIRAMVIVSLMSQSILILIGNKRKHSTRNWLRFILWLAYLSAGWVAIVSLSVLSIKRLQYHEDDYSNNIPNYIVTAFWAPFLLPLLGGPDTVTVYSLEDNQLRWRHFLMLLVQVGVAFHVFVRSWTSNLLNFLSVPMFVAGIIKFGERT